MPSRLPSLKVVRIVLAPCLLVLGIWLGAHPRFLPGPIADALAGPEDRRVALEALDKIHDKYYRPVERRRLSNAAISGAVRNLDDRFSAYFSPRDYGRFQQALDNEFSGVGTAVRGVKDGLRSDHLQALSLGSVGLCIALWIRAKTVDQDERGNAERRALFVGLWPTMFWLISASLERRERRRRWR